MENMNASIESLKAFHLAAISSLNERREREQDSFDCKYNALHSSFCSLLSTNEAVSVQLAASNQQTVSLKLENKRMRRENQELIMKENILENAIKKIEEQSDVFRNSLSSEHQQNEHLNNELQRIQCKCSQSETECKQKERVIDEVKQELNEKDIEYKLMENRFNAQSKQYSEKQSIYNAQISLLINKLNEIDGRKYEHLRKDIEHLQEQSNSDSLKNIDLQKKIESNKEDLSNIAKERDLANSQVSSLLLRIQEIQEIQGIQSSDISHQCENNQPQSILKKKVHFDL